MAKQYKRSLLTISLTPLHWDALHDLSRSNRSTIDEIASDYLEKAMQDLIDEAAYINGLQEAYCS
jgi:hypothetical protein